MAKTSAPGKQPSIGPIRANAESPAIDGARSAEPSAAAGGGLAKRALAEAVLSPRIAMRRRKLLVTWSGGLDSTYGLVRMLRETDDEVFVHHIHRFAPHDDESAPAQSALYEVSATASMLPLIRAKYRDFAYSESLVDNTVFPQFAPDAATVLLFAGCMARKLGFSPDDRILDVMNSDEDGDWIPGSIAGRLLRANSLHILKLVLGAEMVPELYTYADIPTKQQEVDYLPRDLVELNASCRSPSYVDGSWVNCGVCRKCRSFIRMGVQLPGLQPASMAAELTANSHDQHPKTIVETRPVGQLKQLVMYSGGDASTRVLERILRDTQDQVHVHHIRLSGRLDRQPDELSLGGHAFEATLKKLEGIRQSHRPFRVTINTIGPLRLVEHTHPMNVIGYVAAQIAMSWRMRRIDRIALGSWGDGSGIGEGRSALYRSGEVLAPRMVKAVMRSEDGPAVEVGAR